MNRDEALEVLQHLEDALRAVPGPRVVRGARDEADYAEAYFAGMYGGMSPQQRLRLVRERRRFIAEALPSPPSLTGNGDRRVNAEPVVVARDPIVVRQRSRASWSDDW